MGAARLTLPVIAALALASSSATAEPIPDLFARFKSVCLDTAGDRNRVEAELRGWKDTALRPAVLPGLGGPLAKPLLKTLEIAGDEYLVAAGYRQDRGRNVIVCTMSGPGLSSTYSAVEDWVGPGIIPQGDPQRGSATFTWVDAAGARKPAPPLEEARRSRTAVSWLTVTEGANGGSIILSIAQPR